MKLREASLARSTAAPRCPRRPPEGSPRPPPPTPHRVGRPRPSAALATTSREDEPGLDSRTAPSGTCERYEVILVSSPEPSAAAAPGGVSRRSAGRRRRRHSRTARRGCVSARGGAASCSVLLSWCAPLREPPPFGVGSARPPRWRSGARRSDGGAVERRPHGSINDPPKVDSSRVASDTKASARTATSSAASKSSRRAVGRDVPRRRTASRPRAEQ